MWGIVTERIIKTGCQRSIAVQEAGLNAVTILPSQWEGSLWRRRPCQLHGRQLHGRSLCLAVIQQIVDLRCQAVQDMAVARCLGVQPILGLLVVRRVEVATALG